MVQFIPVLVSCGSELGQTTCMSASTRVALPKKIKTKGLVIPADWDEMGNVSAVVISTHDEENYRVKLDRKGRELLPLIRKPVKVSGMLRMNDGDIIIDVERKPATNTVELQKLVKAT